jgi:hypothetical protein
VNYRPWRATVNGVAVTPQTEVETGKMVISVPAGHSDVRIWFGHTPDRTLGPAVSLAGLVVFLLVRRTAAREWSEASKKP